MQRRDFLSASAVAVAATSLASAACAAGESSAPRQYFEWRSFRLADDEKHLVVSNYLQHAAIPAWGRAGLGPVGCFTEVGPAATRDLHVLLVADDVAQLAAARAAVEADADYQTAAKPYLAGPPADPIVRRIDSWLMRAFPAAPQATAPQWEDSVAGERIYELRTYESHNEERARAKIDMFCSGEMPIFDKCGFQSVFYGECLVGSGLPCLKYMLAAPDLATNEAGWKKFVEHPDWLAMRDLPQYKDTVSNIQKLYLAPTEFSQL